MNAMAWMSNDIPINYGGIQLTTCQPQLKCVCSERLCKPEAVGISANGQGCICHVCYKQSHEIVVNPYRAGTELSRFN